jgi:hypothetical protein
LEKRFDRKERQTGPKRKPEKSQPAILATKRRPGFCSGISLSLLAVRRKLAPIHTYHVALTSAERCKLRALFSGISDLEICILNVETKS